MPSKAASNLSLRPMVSARSSIQMMAGPAGNSQLGLLDEGPARDNGAQTGLPDGGFQAGAADCVVEVHAGFAAEGRRDVDQGACDTRRKQNADMTLALPRWT